MVRTRATNSATISDEPSRVEAPMAPPPPNHSADNPTRSTLPTLSVVHRPHQVDRAAYEDIQSPYYINTADHPGLSLVTPVLSDKNFQPWKRDFKLSIGARNKTPFLEVSSPTEHSNTELNQCKHKNSNKQNEQPCTTKSGRAPK
ncbi:hypothetical protein G4B88_018840 [Cannabis sativa]|uniref:Retrotransposon Copia-like N-terminal domain-containing protein n=1 Tax=Cannabis sativa TaxID=3483 RepID=A0A7J6EE07_CANSA|nr:hypothetical protein G4B88_018840 [Cannabis sativa]